MLQEGLDFSATGGPVGMVEVVEHFKSWNGEGDFGKWSVDQVHSWRAFLQFLNLLFLVFR